MSSTSQLASNPRELTTPADPIIARRRLGIRLRELREARSLRLEDVAVSLGVAPSTLSRIETGKAPTRCVYLASMLNLYGVDDPELQQQLADLASEGQGRSWWSNCSDLLPDDTGRYLSLEASACLVRSYSTQTVPALLQTRNYATAVCQATRPHLTADQIRRLVAITMRRQIILRGNGTNLHLLIDESALVRRIAAADIMAAQLDHLRAMAARDSLTVQVVALTKQLPVLSPSFAVLSFIDPSDTDIAASYGPDGQLLIRSADSEVNGLVTTFTVLAQVALSPTDSLSRINDLACKYQ